MSDKEYDSDSQGEDTIGEKDKVKSLKRRPGRPKKHIPREIQTKKGILEINDNKNYLVELSYENLTTFKKISSFFKSLNSDKIHIEFLPLEMNIYTKNFKEQTDTRIRFHGEKMNSYWSEAPFSVDINFTNLESIFSKLDKIYTLSKIIVDKKSQNKHIMLILENEFYIDEKFDINIILDEKSQNIEYGKSFETDDNIYQLEFKLPGKYFKKMISDSKQMDKQWTIEKHGSSGPLLFKYKSENNQVSATLTPKKSKLHEFDIRTTLGEREILSVSIYIDNIKPTASAQLGNDVYFKVSKDKPLRIFTKVDGDAVSADIIVSTVNYKAQDATLQGN